MKNILLATFLLTLTAATAQTEEKSLSPFKKIVASPRISIVLMKGDKESISLLYNNISPEKVNVKVKGNTLHIYLDHARLVEKQRKVSGEGYEGRRSVYFNASVTAYVTYKELKALEIRGEGEVTCDQAIVSEKFKLRAYGETEIRLASLKTKKFKASLYGENDLKIKSGEADRQVYRLFGENKIDTRGLSSTTAAARIYGEGRLSLSASDEVRLNAFGEPVIAVTGNPVISKGIVIGEVAVRTNQ